MSRYDKAKVKIIKPCERTKKLESLKTVEITEEKTGNE